MTDIGHLLTIEDLRARGEPSFFERDPITLKGKLVAWFETASKRTLYPDQTEMFLIEMLAYALSLQGEEGQGAALQGLVAWAQGSHLDDVAGNVQIFRQPAARALARIRFTLPAPSAIGTTIPAGTIVAAGTVRFRTTAGLLVAIGETTGDVEAEAIEPGVSGNGFLPGQITGSVTGVATAVNITESGGGSDIEGDERLAFRTIHAFDRVDRRGGWAGYGQAVLGVSPAITDVAIDRPAPGRIDLYALTGDDSAGPDLRARIEAALSPEDARPHGDDVQSKVATGVGFTVIVTVRSNRLPVLPDTSDPVVAKLIDDIRAEVDTAVRAAFKTFRRPALQPSRRTKFVPVRGLLGAQVSPSPLIKAAQGVEGIVDVDVAGIVFADLPFYEYLRCVAGDAGLVVAAGAAGAIRASTDEGATYATRASAGSYAGTFTGAAARGNRVCLVGTSAEIEFAANGAIFNRVAPDGAYAGDFTAISGDGAGNVVAVGTGGCIMTSPSDGQGGWVKRDAPGGYTGTYRAVKILPTGFGIAVGDNGAVHETSDFGATWRDGHPDPAFAGRFTAIAIAAGKAVIVGEGSAIQTKALPDGAWVARSAAGGSAAAFRAVALDANADAIALGDGGLVQRTSRITGAAISYTVPAGSDMLKTAKVYFFRLRYSDAQGRWSPWSTGTAFATSDTFNYVRQPENVAPAAGDDAASTTPTLQSGAFSVVGAPDVHSRSRWQVARDLAFSQVVYDSGESTDLVAHAVPAGSALADQQTFYWRVAFKGQRSTRRTTASSRS